MWLVIIIIIAVVFWAYSSSRQAEREREEARKKRERIAHIKRDYPNAYSEYWGKPVDTTPYYQYRTYLNSTYIRQADERFSDFEWEVLEKRVLANKKEKKETELKQKADKEWETAQATFSEKMRTLARELLPTFGNYTYTYSIKTKNGVNLNMRIWQHFTYETCLEKDLDYTYNQLALNNTNKLPNQQQNGVILSERYYKQIYTFISKIASEKKVLVFFNEDIYGWSIEALANSYMFELPNSVNDINVAADRALELESKSGKDLLKDESPECVVVIDAFTTNDQLKRNCEYIFNVLQDKHPLLAYISLVKTYDRQEMIAYIERSKTEAEKHAAEEKAKEEERRKREAEELAEKKRKEELRARLQGTAKDVLVNNAKRWECLYGDFYYTWLFYYYPTTCDFEASESEWDDRYTVWDFKNDPEKGINPEDHKKSLDDVIPRIKQKLIGTFGEDYLQFLTLVCLPASTNAKNVARYDDFSNRLCEETGMENAFAHVHIIQDGMSKKDPRNTTGRSIQPVIEYDKAYFKGRYILLFDDVVTKGGTMLRYKEAMEREDATVIGGICLGKTKHERPIQQRIVNIDEYDLPI